MRISAGVLTLPQHERIDGSQFCGERAYAFQRQQGMLQMVEHTHEEDNVEAPDALRREVVHVELAIVDARIVDGVHLPEAGIVPAIDGHNLGAAALEFEAKPAVPGADVEYAFALEVGGDGELGEAILQAGEVADTLDDRSVGQFEAVPPAFLGALGIPVADVFESRRWH
ncbi:MAG: hypothetical protein WDO73_13890 [Ignavibacteriota bacterium]